MKTTRSNFSRKAITFGVVIFVCIALVATGFAAWMISNGSTAEGTSNVDVVTVSNADIKINLDNLTSEGKLDVQEIVFAPKSDDTNGFIQHTETEDNRTENLSFSFAGNVSNGDKVGTLTFAVKLPDSVINAAGLFRTAEGSDTWTYDAERAYITLPYYAVDSNGKSLPIIDTQNGGVKENLTTGAATISINSDTVLTGDGVKDTGNVFSFRVDDSKNYLIAGSVAFGWGEVFGFGNPGRTLDSADGEQTGEVTKYSLPEAELLLRLVRFVNAGASLDSYKFGEPATNIVTKGNVNASDIKLSTLGTLENIAGSTKEEKIANLNAALEKAEAGLTAPTYTLVITAQPK